MGWGGNSPCDLGNHFHGSQTGVRLSIVVVHATVWSNTVQAHRKFLRAVVHP